MDVAHLYEVIDYKIGSYAYAYIILGQFPIDEYVITVETRRAIAPRTIDNDDPESCKSTQATEEYDVFGTNISHQYKFNDLAFVTH